ncbi:hypothetical protein OHB00_29460 [Streptomyces sp. NBC_00631]|uniref:hypothetical protein n=1 Tax=Streptomyces sp. NBC_00631 TaxID=2975793 RepID=UPI0030DF5A77
MPLFARAAWPGDHRDEIVAGTLVAAVIVVLGYASGIGTPQPTTVDTAAPPSAGPSGGSAASGSGPVDSGSGSGADSGAASGGNSLPGGGGYVLPVSDGTSSTGAHDGPGTGGAGTTGTTGGMPMPTPAPSGSASASPTPAPSPVPSSSNGCTTGEVRLLQPLLTGTVGQVTGLLDGLLGTAASPSPSPSSPSTRDPSSVCVGLAPSPSVLSEVLP